MELFRMIQLKLEEPHLADVPMERIVFTGGGAKLEGFLNVAKYIFQRKVRLATARGLEGMPAVSNTRCVGTLAALDVASTNTGGGYLDSIGPKLHAEFLDRDILLRPLGNVLYFLPPYVISEDEIHRVFDAMEEVLGEL